MARRRGFRTQAPKEVTVVISGVLWLTTIPSASASSSDSRGYFPARVRSGGAFACGLFPVRQRTPGVRLELEANPSYWRPGLPRSQRLVILDLEPRRVQDGEFRLEAGQLRQRGIATTTLGAVSLPGQVSFISSIAPIAALRSRENLMSATGVSSIVMPSKYGALRT